MPPQLAISLTAASFKTVDENDICIRRDDITRVVSDKAELQGTRYYGLSTTLICYPRLLIGMSLQLKARSSDGLELELGVDVEYRLQTDGLKQLYDKLGKDYKPLYRDLAASSLRNTASKFKAVDFLGGSRCASDAGRAPRGTTVPARRGGLTRAPSRAVAAAPPERTFPRPCGKTCAPASSTSTPTW